MPPALTAAIDAFADEQKPPASRSEAVRALVARQLVAMGRVDEQALPQALQAPTEADMQASAAVVRAQAADAVDEALSWSSATAEQKAERRGALTDEPAVIGRARGKGRAK